MIKVTMHIIPCQTPSKKPATSLASCGLFSIGFTPGAHPARKRIPSAQANTISDFFIFPSLTVENSLLFYGGNRHFVTKDSQQNPTIILDTAP